MIGSAAAAAGDCARRAGWLMPFCVRQTKPRHSQVGAGGRRQRYWRSSGRRTHEVLRRFANASRVQADLVGGEQTPREAELAGFGDLRRNLSASIERHMSPAVP